LRGKRMRSIQRGMKESLTEIVGGSVLWTLIVVFWEAGFLSRSFLLGIVLVLTLCNIVLVLSIFERSVGYLFGWLLGTIILAISGLLDRLEAMLFIVVPLLILFLKIMREAKVS